jgi:hypothetical protein
MYAREAALSYCHHGEANEFFNDLLE